MVSNVGLLMLLQVKGMVRPQQTSQDNSKFVWIVENKRWSIIFWNVKGQMYVGINNCNYLLKITNYKICTYSCIFDEIQILAWLLR